MRRRLAIPWLLSTVAPGLALAAQPGKAQTQDSALHELAATLEFIRARNERDYAITSAQGIDEGRYVTLGGIDQWITIRGEDRGNPVVLFLHGGPGDATNPWGYAAFRSWLTSFTVVQWDQRGAGRTLGRHRPFPTETITVERLVQDGIELAEHLREALDEDRIILVGHSFGSILGSLIARARPDLFLAYVGTGQVGDPTTSYSVAHGELLERAAEMGNAFALRELREVGPPPYGDGRGYAVQRKWSNAFEGADMLLSSMLGFALTAPGYSTDDINDWIAGQVVSAEALVPVTSAMEPEFLEGEFSLPVFVIQGAEDYTTPTPLARAWLASIRAPRKEFIALESAGHFAVFLKPREFVQTLAEQLESIVARDW